MSAQITKETIAETVEIVKSYFNEFRKNSIEFIKYWENAKGYPDAKKKIEILVRIVNLMQEGLDKNSIHCLSPVGYFTSTLGGQLHIEKVLRMPQKPSSNINYKKMREEAVKNWDLLRMDGPIDWPDYKANYPNEWEKIREIDDLENLTNNLA